MNGESCPPFWEAYPTGPSVELAASELALPLELLARLKLLAGKADAMEANAARAMDVVNFMMIGVWSAQVGP